ncbi:MAG: TraM recognition domain-containing protein [Vulcanimicrobiaceae bacterium]
MLRLRPSTYAARLGTLLLIALALSVVAEHIVPPIGWALALVAALVPFPLPHLKAKAPAIAPPAPNATGPLIRLARATGKLAERGHVSALAPGQLVTIDANNAYGGTLVLGPMGSGKTRGVLQRWVRDWLSWPSSGLFAYGVKPNWSRVLARIAIFCGRRDDQIHIVGPGHEPWPLMRGLEPDGVANFVRAAFALDAKHSGGDAFFKDSAVNLVRRAATILYAACDDERPLEARVVKDGQVVKAYTLAYDLNSLLELVHATGDSWHAIANASLVRCAAFKASGMDDEANMLEDAVHGMATLTADLAGRTRGGIVGSIDSVVEPFIASQPLRRAFCGTESFDLTVLEKGHVIILDVDLGEYAAAARLVYLLAFEQMRRFMLRRTAKIDEGKPLNPIAFIADEYAEVATAAHQSMWRLCREAHIAPVVAYQLQSDLQRVAGGKDAADALVVGFGTKVLFVTDDSASLGIAGSALGQSEVERTSMSRGSSGQGGSYSSQTSQQLRAVVDAQLMHGLQNDIRREVPLDQQWAEVVLIVNQGGHRMADIARVRAWDPPAAPARREQAFSDLGPTRAARR